MKTTKKWSNLLLLSLATAIVACPLAFLKNADFGGTDDAAKETIRTVAPGYQPWFHSLMVPPSGEIESLLFAVQAAIGAGGIGYVIGFYRGRSVQRSGQEEKKP